MTATERKLAFLARTTARWHASERGDQLVASAIGYFNRRAGDGDHGAAVAMFDIVVALFPPIPTSCYKDLKPWQN